MLTRINLTGVDQKKIPTVLPRPAPAVENPESIVQEIITDVRVNGDRALRGYAEKFDGGAPATFLVPSEEFVEAEKNCSEELVKALQHAASRIRDFHENQMRKNTVHKLEGITVRTIHQPVQRAGCYVPGGRAAYPSTLLMTAIPALVAGVDDVCVCAPPNEKGKVDSATLVAAKIAGVEKVFMVGGAQAIAAMAYGTESIQGVDVIVGPGNIYVATAKKLVAGDVGIAAAFAGPSEIVVIADQDTNPKFAAIDLIVQAEHGPGGIAWLISWSEDAINSVLAEVEKFVKASPRVEDIEATFSNGGYAILVEDAKQAMEVANLVAPEHLQIMSSNPDTCLQWVRNAGAVFVGQLTPASVGDYVAGPSHVLPTDGTARFANALTVDDFIKDIHIVDMDQKGFNGVAETITTIAEAERLDAHAQSIRMRLEEQE